MPEQAAIANRPVKRPLILLLCLALVVAGESAAETVRVAVCQMRVEDGHRPPVVNTGRDIRVSLSGVVYENRN